MPKVIMALSFVLGLSIISPFKFLSIFSAHYSNRAAERAANSVVKIVGDNPAMEGWHGMIESHYACTGWVISPKRVLTAAHCTGDHMTVDGHPTEVVKMDPYYDLALLKDNLNIRPILVMRDEQVSRFEELSGIGYGMGWNQLSILKERVVLPVYAPNDDLPVGIIVSGGYIGGMSGGPVVDASGMAVGIIQRSYEDSGYGVGIQLIKAFLLGADIQ